MPSFTNLDSDAERLPSGMTRTGYDADTQVYTYTDSNGAVYEGLPGNRYGQLRPTTRRSEDGDLQPMGYATDHGEEVYQEARNADWKYLAPFLLIVAVFLLVVLKFVLSGGGDSDGHGGSSGLVARCRDEYVRYVVDSGDTCWGIAQRFDMTVDQLKLGFEDGMELNCDKLKPGQSLCVLDQRS